MTVPVDSRYPWKVLGIVMLGTLMAALDSSIVNVSIPAIMANFGSPLDDITWVITGYMLAFAAFMPVTAWLRNRIGHKKLYISSLAVFTIGSVLCGLAWSLPSLVLARVIQAIGGGAIMPTAMAMISEEFAPADRPKAFAYWGMGVIIGPALGPTLGGWITSAIGWRFIFLVNLPIGIAGIFWAYQILKPDHSSLGRREAFDIWGFIGLTVFLICFLLGLSKGEHEGWSSAYIVTCFILSALGMVTFLLAESLVKNGIVDLTLLRSPVFAACVLVCIIRSLALFGGAFLVPMFLQQIRGMDEIECGLMLLPGSLVIGFMMPLTPRLIKMFSTRALTIAGLLVSALCMYLYRDIDANTSVWNLIFPTLLRGIGLGLLFTPITTAALNALPNSKAGMASSMMNLMQQIGGSIGIAILTTVLGHRIKFHMAATSSFISDKSAAFLDTQHQLAEHAHNFGYTYVQSAQIAGASVGKALITSASIGGFQDAFLFGSILMTLGVAAAFFLPSKNIQTNLQSHATAME